MLDAWAGKILHVDLTKGNIRKEPLSKEFGVNFFGSRGINARLLWDYLKPGIDVFSPENVLIFGAGTLSGTSMPGCGRTTITCKGAATNLYNKTNVGGHFGAELKLAGYDHIVFHGASEKPVYLCIDNDNVEIRNAQHLWGMDVRETDKDLRKELGDRHIKIAYIGPGGENLVRFAAVMTDIYQAAARGGAGAVMGSKKLKAIAVRGSAILRCRIHKNLMK